MVVSKEQTVQNRERNQNYSVELLPAQNTASPVQMESSWIAFPS